MDFATIRAFLLAICVIIAAALEIIWFFILDLLRPFIGIEQARSMKIYLIGVYLRMLRFFVTDMKIVVSGDIDKVKATAHKKSIFLQNHQTELDWYFGSFFYSIFHKEGDFSAIMKGDLGSVPVFGYAIRDVNMCLLDRNWEKDKQSFDQYLDNYVTNLRPISVLLCPEGTTFSRSTYESSQRFAKKTCRPVLEHLLLPRSTGLSYIVKRLVDEYRKTGEEYYVYDTTMQFEGYSGEICGDNYEREVDVKFPSVDNLFYKRIPTVMHLHVTVTSIQDIVQGAVNSDDVARNVEKWLDDSWVKKDKQMEYFINSQCWDSEWNENREVYQYDRLKKWRQSPLWIGLMFLGILFDMMVVNAVKWIALTVKSMWF